MTAALGLTEGHVCGAVAARKRKMMPPQPRSQTAARLRGGMVAKICSLENPSKQYGHTTTIIAMNAAAPATRNVAQTVMPPVSAPVSEPAS